jgi:carboxymethylenebutenolidase
LHPNEHGTRDRVIQLEPQYGVVMVGDAPLPIAEIELAGSTRGAAIVAVQAGTLSDIGTRATQLVGHGYATLATDLSVVPEDRRIHALALLVDRLAERDWSLEQIGAIGYGDGGTEMFDAATRFGFGAAVSVAADLSTRRTARGVLRSPWLGLFGGAGGQHDAAHIREVSGRLADASGVYCEVVSYPDVDQNWYRNSFGAKHLAAEFDSWQRTVEWLNLRVAPRPSPLLRAWRDGAAS